MKQSETLYTQLTDRQLSLKDRLDLSQQCWNADSKQMIFDWLSGLVVNRKKSGLDSADLVHRVWQQLVFYLNDVKQDRVSIKPSFIKTITEALNNENIQSNQSVIDCCILIGQYGKELDYKYELLVDLLHISLTKHGEYEPLLTMILNKYWTTIRVQGNINKVFLDLCKQLLGSLLAARLVHHSLTSLIDDILKHIVFHRTWITAYRDYVQSVTSKSSKKTSVSPLFTALESLVVAGDPSAISFLPLIFRHCIGLVDQEHVSDVFELLVEMNSWLERISNTDLYIDGIRQLLQILDEKHVIDQLLSESLNERLTLWMKDILFKRNIEQFSKNYSRLCLVCLHLYPSLIESNLSQIIQSLINHSNSLSIFLIGYINLYARMRSLAKLVKRLSTVFDSSFILPMDVIQHYRQNISECSHSLIDEIWLSLLDHSENNLIIIQLIGALLDGYRLFDLNIPRDTLQQQCQDKYDRTLERLRQTMSLSSNSTDRICVLQCYLSLGWFSLSLLSFSSSVSPIEDIPNHNGLLLSHSQWNSLRSESDLRPILFSLSCQRIYRSLFVNENEIDRKLFDDLFELSSSSSNIFEPLEPFFDLLSPRKQLKLIKIFIREIIDKPNLDRSWFIANEYRLSLIVQACVQHVIEQNLNVDSPAKKRQKIDFEKLFEDDAESLYEYLSTKSCSIDGKIVSLFSSLHFNAIQSMSILISIGWLTFNSIRSLEAMQILIDLISCSRMFPLTFITRIVDITLETNNTIIIGQVLSILSAKNDYHPVLKQTVMTVLNTMQSSEDSTNIRLLERHLQLLHHTHNLFSPSDLCPIIDRLLNSTSQSSISYSSLDTRYILAMVILNSLSNFDNYQLFLERTWKSLVREMNENLNLKCVTKAYAQQWKEIMKTNSTIEDIDALVRCLHDEYLLVSQVIESLDQQQFQQWMETTLEHIKIPLIDREEEIDKCRQAFQLIQTLAHCSIKKDTNVNWMNIVNYVTSQCGPLLIRLPLDFSQYSQVASFVFSFAIDVLITKKTQLRSQVALSLLQCCLHLPTDVLFALHSNICKLVSLLIKFHTATLCKHVSSIEAIFKLLLHSIVIEAKRHQETNEKLIEAARDTTKLAAHLIEQCKEDFRSTIVYVLIDYVHLLSRAMFLSPAVKKTLNGVAFELFHISGERVEQYSGQMAVGDRELLKQLHQQFKQYHMFKGAV